MRSMIINTLEAIAGLCVVINVGLGLMVGVSYGQFYFIGNGLIVAVFAVLGAIVAFMLSSIVFGMLYVMLDIRASLNRMIELAGQDVEPPARRS